MLSVVIQAGGESRRMGQDKALAPFLGGTLIQRVLARVAHLGDEVILTTNQPEAYAFLGYPLASDVIPGRGALGGLYTALSAASRPLVMVVACDMPFASTDLLTHQRELLESGGFDAVIPRTPGGTEPYHAVYRRANCLPRVLEAIQADKWRVDAWYAKANVRLLSPEETRPHDPDGLAFWNVNTPEELAEAERMVRERYPHPPSPPLHGEEGN
jgi:molybdopterin-guanine dinucleotide biosynthesis protein A